MIKEAIHRFTSVFFQGVTISQVALWLRTLIFNCWGAVGNVATNALLQLLAGAAISKAELFRSMLSQIAPVVLALLWPSPLQRRAIAVTETQKPYIAPRDIDEPKS